MTTNYHSWTHRPRSQGGTDPIESLALWPVKVFRDDIQVATDPPFTYLVPQDLDNHTLIRVESFVNEAGGSDLEVQLEKNGTDDMLTDLLVIDGGDLNSKDSATPATINATNANVVWGDHIKITVVSDGGGAYGLGVYMYFLAGPDAVGVVQGPQGEQGIQGVEGPQGDPGDTGPQGDPGGIVAWTGEWDSGTSYSIDDAVSWNGSSYVAIDPSTNVEPGVDAGWETDWMLLSEGLTLPLPADDVSITDAGGYFTATDVEGALQELASPPVVKVHHTSTQSISSGGWTALTFSSEDVDTDGMHESVTNPTRITCVETGFYLVMGNYQMAANGTGTRWIGITKNAASSPDLAIVGPSPGSGSFDARLEVSVLCQLTATDYVRLFVYQDSGTSLNIKPLSGGGDFDQWFSAIRVA